MTYPRSLRLLSAAVLELHLGLLVKSGDLRLHEASERQRDTEEEERGGDG